MRKSLSIAIFIIVVIYLFGAAYFLYDINKKVVLISEELGELPEDHPQE